MEWVGVIALAGLTAYAVVVYVKDVCRNRSRRGFRAEIIFGEPVNRKDHS